MAGLTVSLGRMLSRWEEHSSRKGSRRDDPLENDTRQAPGHSIQMMVSSGGLISTLLWPYVVHEGFHFAVENDGQCHRVSECAVMRQERACAAPTYCPPESPFQHNCIQDAPSEKAPLGS